MSKRARVKTAMVVALWGFGVAWSPARAVGQCCGDCDGDGAVTIDEIITGVNHALGSCSDDGICDASVKTCADDAVVAGTVCMDKYEASVWRVPNPTTTNAALVKKIQQGKATEADLTEGEATQLGTAGDDYAPCTDNGQNCANDIYAVSLAGVTPAAYITWFQAQEACANARKRLPTSAEWQVAATGTPDAGPDNGATDCNTASTHAVTSTGSRSSCVSARGAFDMVGNLVEKVADWVPRSTACPGWGGFSDDLMCLAGADAASVGLGSVGPGALGRGGNFLDGTDAGVFYVFAMGAPNSAINRAGFRCAR
jgi:hypothetical protein